MLLVLMEALVHQLLVLVKQRQNFAWVFIIIVAIAIYL